MPHLPALITDLALILISAGVTTLLFKWLKQPLVLGYIIAGLLAGPYIHIFPTVGDQANINTWAEIGVVFLLFALGLEFSFKKLANVGSSALITATTEVITMLLAGYFVGHLLGWSTMNSIFLGGMLSMSSTTIIIKAFDDLGVRNQRFTSIVFGTLVIEDLIAILMMVLLSTVAVSQKFIGKDLLVSLFKVVFFLILWFLIGIYLIPAFLKRVGKLMNDETLLIIALGLCLGMVVVATQTGFSAALGAFIMGSILAETVEAERIERLIRPVKDLFGAIFFVSVGMLVNPAILVRYAWPILIVTLVTVFGKALFSSFGVLLSGQSLQTAVRSGFSLAQIGEFAFIIAGLGVSLKVLDPYVAPIIVAVSVITTFTTPYMIRLAGPFSQWLYRALPPGTVGFIDRYASGRKTVNHDSDWKKLLKAQIRKAVVYAVLLTAVFLLSTQVVYPFVRNRFPDTALWADLAICSVTLLLMAPFLWALISNKHNSPDLFLRLWNDNKYNHGRLVALVLFRTSVAVFFISAVLIAYLPLRNGAIVVLAVAVLALIWLFRRNLNQYAAIETQFLSNLNGREAVARERYPLQTSFDSELKDKDIHLVSLKVSPYSPAIGKSLAELSFREKYGINVVEIVRGDQTIYIPGGDDRLYPQDKVVLVGPEERLNRFCERIERGRKTREKNKAPEKITLHSFTVDENFRFLGQTIAGSRVGKKYDNLIVGIERGGRLLSPDKDLTFEPGDLVWIVGERDKIRRMLRQD